MKIEKSDIKRDRFCNECLCQENIKEIKIGNFNLALCKKCRNKLTEMLFEDLVYYEGKNNLFKDVDGANGEYEK